MLCSSVSCKLYQMHNFIHLLLYHTEYFFLKIPIKFCLTKHYIKFRISTILATGLFTLNIVLHFSECHMVGIIQNTAF